MLIVGSSLAGSSVVSLERQREPVESALPVVVQPQSQSAQLIRRPVVDIQRLEPLDSRPAYREGFVISEDDFRTRRALAAYTSVEGLRDPVGRVQQSNVDAYA